MVDEKKESGVEDADGTEFSRQVLAQVGIRKDWTLMI
jgi:hypothetical protein